MATNRTDTLNYKEELRIYFSTFDSTVVGFINNYYYLYVEDCYFTGGFADSVIVSADCYMSTFKRNCCFKTELVGESLGILHSGLSFSKIAYNSFAVSTKNQFKYENYALIAGLTHELWNCNCSYLKDSGFYLGRGSISYSVFFYNSESECDVSFVYPENVSHIIVGNSANIVALGESAHVTVELMVKNSNFFNLSSLVSSSSKISGSFIASYFDKDYSNNNNLFTFIDNVNNKIEMDIMLLNTYKCLAKFPMTIEATHSFQVSFPTIHPASVSSFIIPSKDSNDLPYPSYTHNNQINTPNQNQIHFNIPLLSSIAALIIVVIAAFAVVIGCKNKSSAEARDEVDNDINSLYKSTKYNFPIDNGAITEDDFF